MSIDNWEASWVFGSATLLVYQNRGSAAPSKKASGERKPPVSNQQGAYAPRSPGRSFTHHRNHDGALAWANIAFQMHNLLPGSQQELAVGNGNGQFRPQERCLEMRMTIAVVPGLLVTIGAAGRQQPIEDRRKILPQARLELNGADSRRTADV